MNEGLFIILLHHLIPFNSIRYEWNMIRQNWNIPTTRNNVILIVSMTSEGLLWSLSSRKWFKRASEISILQSDPVIVVCVRLTIFGVNPISSLFRCINNYISLVSGIDTDGGVIITKWYKIIRIIKFFHHKTMNRQERLDEWLSQHKQRTAQTNRISTFSRSRSFQIRVHYFRINFYDNFSSIIPSKR